MHCRLSQPTLFGFCDRILHCLLVGLVLEIFDNDVIVFIWSRPKYDASKLKGNEARSFLGIDCCFCNFWLRGTPSWCIISLIFRHNPLKVWQCVDWYIIWFLPKYEASILKGGKAQSFLVVDCCFCHYWLRGTTSWCIISLIFCYIWLKTWQRVDCYIICSQPKYEAWCIISCITSLIFRQVVDCCLSNFDWK